MDELRLEVTAFTDAAHWRWRLTDADGAFKADHQVALNRADPEYDAFTDLYTYLRYHEAPDRRLEHEAEIIDRLGRWIGAQVRLLFPRSRGGVVSPVRVGLSAS